MVGGGAAGGGGGGVGKTGRITTPLHRCLCLLHLIYVPHYFYEILLDKQGVNALILNIRTPCLLNMLALIIKKIFYYYLMCLKRLGNWHEDSR